MRLAADRRGTAETGDCRREIYGREVSGPLIAARLSCLAGVPQEPRVAEIVALNFFTVPTVTFRVRFVLILLAHDRRRILYFNVTEHPSAQWTARQPVEAFPGCSAPSYLLRDRDGVYGQVFDRRVAGLGMAHVRTAHKAPGRTPMRSASSGAFGGRAGTP